MSALTESARDPATAISDEVVLAGDGWTRPIRKGQVYRIVDLEGNQAADTLFYDLADPADRYDATQTIRRQGGLYLTTGSVLRSTRGEAMLTIVADTCGRHDTLGGACSCESNQVRYSLDRLHMHSCRDTFLLQVQRHGLGKRDIAHNINFFMNVPVTPAGALTFADGISAPGRYVELRAERDVLAVVSNCPQLNNPCNGWNPTPVRMLVWDP
jgi:urea carboxylase-associated protein 1